MITATDAAIKSLSMHFKDKDIQPIRVHLADGGCSGPRLSLAIDELRDGDKSVEQGDFTFLIQSELAEVVGAITIDMSEYGFTLASEREVPGAGGGCGCSSCGTGTCGGH
ncbi:heme biosynthesis protein HemY [Pseudodesulfovibrio cashew]|uniref:Heme biosynthesis protein HemY n=1 Tax=Pseudodesulfovibrio cashew TaxID=2678688 RepID=A0A6I6JB97_9BACT|nr:IscA/HesB family protein [Pseudodesulfovibrio cashew]QGY40025.1 heme biosynthesis protein HemY [Pseudodesulfovibrio cashew]